MPGDSAPQYQVPPAQGQSQQQYQVPPQMPPNNGQQYEFPPPQFPGAPGTGQQQQQFMPSYQQDPQQQFQMPPGNPNQFQMPSGGDMNQFQMPPGDPNMMFPPGVNESTPMLPGRQTPGGSVNGDPRRRGVSNVRKDRICYLLIILFVGVWYMFGGGNRAAGSEKSKLLKNANATVMPTNHPSLQPTVALPSEIKTKPIAKPSEPSKPSETKTLSTGSPSTAPTKVESPKPSVGQKASYKPTSEPEPEPAHTHHKHASEPEGRSTSGSPDSSAPHSIKNTYSVYKRGDRYHIVGSDVTSSEDDTDESIGESESPVASGEYTKNVDGNGWHYFSGSVPELERPVHMTPTEGDSEGDDHVASNMAIENYLAAMKGLGYIEGFATCNEMNQWYHNFYAGLFNGGDVMPETLTFLEQNYDWTLRQANTNYLISDYWLSVKGVLQQLDGLAEGHTKGCGDLSMTNGPNALVGEQEATATGAADPSSSARRGMLMEGATNLESSKVKQDLSTLTSRTGASIFHLMLVNANGDMFQIEAKYNMEKLYNASHHHSSTSEESEDDDDLASRVHHLLDSGRIGRRGKRVVAPHQPDHCSAIIKLTPDYADVTFAHATWDEFQCASPRIMKRYVFPDVKNNVLLDTNIDMYFSSSPGLLSSVDDYYHAYKEGGTSQLALMETSLDVFDRHLLASIVPTTVLSWMRARIASQMARTGPQWAHYFSTFHSGTYTNQWMVMDLMRFTPGSPPKKDFLIILEEMPGTVHWEDMTANFTRDKYWASFNLPYFDDIGVISGIAEVCRQDDTNCYDKDPRSKLFAKYQHLVVDIPTTEWMIGYNNFAVDRESLGGACNSIACREDLATNASIAYPFGAIDGKVSSVTSAKLPISHSKRSLRSLSSSKSTSTSLPKIYARLGPSDGGNAELPAFCWAPFDDVAKEHAKYPGMRRDRVFSRFGHPECFDYDWQILPPQA